jgi:hypothetical protein
MAQEYDNYLGAGSELVRTLSGDQSLSAIVHVRFEDVGANRGLRV